MHVGGVRFVDRDRNRAIYRFRIAPRRLSRSRRIHIIQIFLPFTRFPIRRVGSRVQQGPIASVLRARKDGNHLRFPTFLISLSPTVRVRDRYDHARRRGTARGSVGPLVRVGRLIFLLLGKGFLLRRHAILAMFRYGLHNARLRALATSQIVGPLILLRVVMDLPRVPTLFVGVLRVTIPSVRRIKFRVVKLRNVFRTRPYR